MVEGRKSVMDLLQMNSERITEMNYSSLLPEYIVAIQEEVEALKMVLKDISHGSIPVYEASLSDMKEISSMSAPPGIIAVCRLPESQPESEILSSPLPQDLYLMLDGIQDPGNLGTIVRTAHWFGIRRIFASKDTVDLYNPKVVQSTMGSLAKVRVDYVDLEKLAEANSELPLIGLLLEGKNIYETPLPSDGFIVMGNEGNGISETLRNRISLPLTIPPYNPHDHSESLNVAIATAITLSEFRR